MSRPTIGALIGMWIGAWLASACGCAGAVAVPPVSVDSRLSLPLLGSTRAPAMPAAWERLLAASWASETATYPDLVAADLPAPTALYDIMAHVVVMPDGARLEAHSGLRERVDDPRFVAERMRGATPPALYDLEPRKLPFHGVAALRLLPVFGNVFGRTGLLAHTYMLHGRPESNGCVVFRDYAAFLRAFRDGRIKRLRVVPSAGDGARIEIMDAARRTA